MARIPEKYAIRWVCDSIVEASGMISLPVTASTSLNKGEVILMSSGYADNSAAVLDDNVIGIAAEDADNSSGSNGDIDVLVIPLLPQYRWWAPVYHATTAIAATNIGELYDIYATDTSYLDIGTTATDGNLGFQVLDIDITSDATTANTMGFAYGMFKMAYVA